MTQLFHLKLFLLNPLLLPLCDFLFSIPCRFKCKLSFNRTIAGNDVESILVWIKKFEGYNLPLQGKIIVFMVLIKHKTMTGIILFELNWFTSKVIFTLVSVHILSSVNYLKVIPLFYYLVPKYYSYEHCRCGEFIFHFKDTLFSIRKFF